MSESIIGIVFAMVKAEILSLLGVGQAIVVDVYAVVQAGANTVARCLPAVVRLVNCLVLNLLYNFSYLFWPESLPADLNCFSVKICSDF